MKRKLQIFVSSTYSDLLVERQAAVEAILRAGHIPAGMELFAAGDKSQLETIYRWIDESDVYMLILGSRYGSVDKDSGKSYTQLEYEYAIATGKRFFAVILTESAIDAKVKSAGRTVIENEHPKELREFKDVVKSKICRMVDDSKDIKLAIHETILHFLREYSFDGWISGKDIVANEELSLELAKLVRENAELRAELQDVRSKKPSKISLDDEFGALWDLLIDEQVTFDSKEEGKEPIRKTVLDWFYAARDKLVTGVSNTYSMSKYDNFLFFKLCPKLSIHGLTEDQKVTGAKWRTIKTTKKGNDFLVYLQKTLVASKRAGATETSAPGKSSVKPAAAASTVKPKPAGVKKAAKAKDQTLPPTSS